MRYRRTVAWVLVGALGCCAAPPEQSEQSEQTRRAAELLQGLDLEQKVGQLFVAWSLSRPQGKNHERLLAAVRDVGLGGVILSLGTVDDAAKLIPQLQAAAKVPLLLAGDFEGGVWYRLRGASELGNQMLVGATGSAALAESMGRITGEEAKALGFHWAFAPVLDVNSNPDNPIINVRSFGEDPELVARLGVAFARGVRSAGVLPCGKHFPGHGDVDTDSHLSLPTVPGDGARLRAVELRPFAAAAADGLESVMTGHLAVPGLGEDPAVPATLSPLILGDVLRGELGFTGLIVTDGLDMGGVTKALPTGEVAVRALLAGADVLLMPSDPKAARDAVVAAVQTGRVPMARLDDAVSRILRSKAKVGLLDGRGGVLKDWRSRVHSREAEAVADTIAARGLTLVRARDGVLPLPAGGARSLLVTLCDEEEGQTVEFAAAMNGVVAGGDCVRLTAASPREQVAEVASRVRGAQLVVLALDVRVRDRQGTLGLPPALLPVVYALAPQQRVVAVSFGDPYVARGLPQADVYLCAYAGTERLQLAAAAVLRGERAVHGRLPVTIPGVAAVGQGLTELPGTELGRAAPADEDMAPDLPQRIAELLASGVQQRAFPGAVCLVARRGQVIAEVAAGRLGYGEDDPPVRLDTRYDLASLTKVCATVPAVLALVAAGGLSLDDPVARWVPAFDGGAKETVTVRQLLMHAGGLPAHAPLYRTANGRHEMIAAAAATALQREPGGERQYSDLGFLLLGAVVEAASGESLALFAQRAVFEPYGMRGAGFVPAEGPPADAAPTELDPARGGVIRGRVHDENAFAMGGVSGHAGLFATASDVLRLGVAMLAGGRGVLPRDLVEQATGPGPDEPYGLGFQRLTDGGFGGTRVPRATFGHTGFTGTSLWCDPRHDLCVVLLTNRVHPSREGGAIQGIRRALHDLVLGSLR